MRHFLCFSLATLLLHPTHGQINNQHLLTDDVRIQEDTKSLPFAISKPFCVHDKARLTRGFEAATLMARFALDWIDTKPTKVFEKYFELGDKAKVKAVFESIIGDRNTYLSGNGRLKNVHFTYLDIYGDCDSKTNPQPGSILMYTSRWDTEVEKPSFIVVCPQLWAIPFPDMNDIKCEQVCTAQSCTLSYRMRSIGEFVLHELIHLTSMIDPIPSGWPKDEWILDQKMKNPDGHDPAEVYIYGTYHAQKAVKSKDKKEVKRAFYNADNYAMFAREAYFRGRCSKQDFKDPTAFEPDPRVSKPKKIGALSVEWL
ncbi:uncharacterized protein NECHADRAFT_79679 [Fusarium vanettenii 77-13-4]|uniref:Lysine-specific metallo-endopeptidase domain-containing protein n=1 Tax=Fusarium vanettenii (strain ATCC MYA-4622 / CBS 123669 / FGSC 9596 / NRRL 45880 / 77-13-4) TaxID=660122 RepID=C7Z864_FUSV7|nr:uncharacterized protein NECHADRAFT_79679 [Fusarium vanettenii 77-13-4]EEU39944.1 predicted protein [Fusarium vanettenii 77-13-4]